MSLDYYIDLVYLVTNSIDTKDLMFFFSKKSSPHRYTWN